MKFIVPGNTIFRIMAVVTSSTSQPHFITMDTLCRSVVIVYKKALSAV